MMIEPFSAAAAAATRPSDKADATGTPGAAVAAPASPSTTNPPAVAAPPARPLAIAAAMFARLAPRLSIAANVASVTPAVEADWPAEYLDLILAVKVVADMDEYRHFILHKLASLKNIGNAQSHFVMNQTQNEHILPWLTN